MICEKATELLGFVSGLALLITHAHGNAAEVLLNCAWQTDSMEREKCVDTYSYLLLNATYFPMPFISNAINIMNSNRYKKITPISSRPLPPLLLQ
jgi:hypothetical protein